jgi:tetratricopeptide (TPR) repeat protein
MSDLTLCPGERETKILPLVAAPRVPSADGWFHLGCELEGASTARARYAYAQAIAAERGHARAHVNLGRLLHEAGDLAGAEACYRRALAASPDDATAAYNLGVALEDRGDLVGAARAYDAAIAADPGFADAHWNLARLAERTGERAHALRHLIAYHRLVHVGA